MNKIGISITTYESDSKTLTHIFWGDTLQDAYNIAKSHLVTDYFFSSSFEGQMKWGTKVLQLSNDGNILPYQDNSKLIEDILTRLTVDAYILNDIKAEHDLPEILNEIKEENVNYLQ